MVVSDEAGADRTHPQHVGHGRDAAHVRHELARVDDRQRGVVADMPPEPEQRGARVRPPRDPGIVVVA